MVFAAGPLLVLAVGLKGTYLHEAITKWPLAVISTALYMTREGDAPQRDSPSQPNRDERRRNPAEWLDDIFRLLKAPSIDL